MTDWGRVYFEEDTKRDGFSVYLGPIGEDLDDSYDGTEWLANFKKTGHAVAFAELVRFFIQGLDEWGTPEARMKMLEGQFNNASSKAVQ